MIAAFSQTVMHIESVNKRFPVQRLDDLYFHTRVDAALLHIQWRI